MKRILAALLLVFSLSLPALAADKAVKLTLDGRPVDRAGGIAFLRNGVVYADAVDLVKSFNGLMTFQGPKIVVSIGTTTATFTKGSRTALINQGSVVMRGPLVLINGDPFVPLDTFVTRVANAKVKFSPDRTRADISVNANPLS